jgi:hemerythrin superfamily protein
MNAIEFLVKEHNKVRSLFADLVDPSHREETRRKIFDTIYEELVRHEKMEQNVWYPELKADKKIHDEIKHLLDEEYDAKKLMDHLNKIKNSDEWDKDIIKLKQDVEHHAQEEEQELFPKVKMSFPEDDLIRIGAKLQKYKENYLN